MVFKEKLRRTMLTHDTLAIEKSKTEVKARVCQEEESDRPSCFDTMTTLYDWDKIRNVCENCGLTRSVPDTPRMAWE